MIMIARRRIKLIVLCVPVSLREWMDMSNEDVFSPSRYKNFKPNREPSKNRKGDGILASSYKREAELR